MSAEDFQLHGLDALLEAARLASGDANEPYYASDFALEGAGSEHDDYGLRVGRKPPPARRPAPTPAGKKKKQKGHRCPNKLLAGGPCICCGARLSPQWRRPLDDESVLCNACGIYYTRHHVLPERRPQAAAPLKEEPDTAEEDDGEYEQQQAAAEQEAAELQQQVFAAVGGQSKLMPGDAMRLMHMHPQPATRSCDSTHLAIPIPNCSPASTADAAAQPQQQQQLLQQGHASQLHPGAQPTPHVRHVATSVAGSVKAAAAAAAVAAATQALAAAGSAQQGADGGPRQQGSNAGSTPGSPSPSESSSFTPHSGTKKRGLGAVVDATSPTVANKVSRTQAPSDQPGPLAGVPGSARMLLQSRLQPVQPPAGMPHGVQVKTEAAAAMELPSPNSAEQAALLLQLASSSRSGPQRGRQQPQARQPAAAQAGGGRAVSQAQAMMQAVTYPAGAAGPQLVALPQQQPLHALVHAGAARPPRAPTHAGQQQQQLQQQQRQAVQVIAPQGQQFAVPRGQQPVVIGLPSFLLNAAGQMVQLPAGAAMRPQAPGAGRPAAAPGAPVLVTHGSSGGGAAGAASGAQAGHSERPAQGTPTLPVAAQQFMAMGPQGPVMLQRTQGGGLQQVPMLLVAGTPMQAQGRAVSGGGAAAGGPAGAAAGMPMQQARGVQLMGHALPPGTVAMRAGPQGMMQAVQMAPMQYMWPGRWVAAAPQQQQQQQGTAQGGL